jgi:hypothetical protein
MKRATLEFFFTDYSLLPQTLSFKRGCSNLYVKNIQMNAKGEEMRGNSLNLKKSEKHN